MKKVYLILLSIALISFLFIPNVQGEEITPDWLLPGIYYLVELDIGCDGILLNAYPMAVIDFDVGGFFQSPVNLGFYVTDYDDLYVGVVIGGDFIGFTMGYSALVGMAGLTLWFDYWGCPGISMYFAFWARPLIGVSQAQVNFSKISSNYSNEIKTLSNLREKIFNDMSEIKDLIQLILKGAPDIIKKIHDDEAIRKEIKEKVEIIRPLIMAELG